MSEHPEGTDGTGSAGNQGGDDEPVIRLPRGRGLTFSGPELVRIAIMVGLLIAVIALTKPCSHAVSTFVMGFDGSAGSARAAGDGSSGLSLGSAKLIPLRGLNEAQIKATVEQAQGRGSAAGSAGPAGSAR